MPAIERSQNDIMQFWLGSECVVSIICATYNHEHYLEDALNGFLAQRTNFPFEIIVHDDASTDDTAKIIQTYTSQYPYIIKPILQVDNQYSKGGFKPLVYAAKSAQGRYIAVCEGDDYWMDENKLQRQVTALEENPDVDLAFHSAYILSEDTSDMRVSWLYGEDGRLPLDTLLNLRVGSFAPTSSYMFRRSVFDLLPNWFAREAPIGDFFIERYGALRGGAFYLSKPMSVYRSLTSGSWTVSMRKDEVAYRRYIDGMCKSLELMAPDFDRNAIAFRKFCAQFYLKYAIEELFRGDEKQFNRMILKSVWQWKYVSKKQQFCYQLRVIPYLLKIILGFRRKHTD